MDKVEFQKALQIHQIFKNVSTSKFLKIYILKSVLFDLDPKILLSYMIAICSFICGIFFLYWNTVDLQCYVSFRCILSLWFPKDGYFFTHPVGWLETHSSSPWQSGGSLTWSQCGKSKSLYVTLEGFQSQIESMGFSGTPSSFYFHGLQNHCRQWL